MRPFSPTSSIGSDSSISVLSSPTAPPSSQGSSHRRRRSTASDIGERRPKKGDDDYIKRPENAFILFRRKKCEERQAAQEEDDGSAGPVKKQRQADLSKTISQQWKSLSPEERQYWEDLAKEKKKEHEAMYPNYVYRPQRTKDKKGKKGKGRGEHDTDTESFSFLMPVSSSPSRSLSRDYVHGGHALSQGRRAASAPTPPPTFQTIQLPTVLMPSCPASPTLIPRISGRSPAPMANIPPPSESAPLTTFDYAPNDQLFMPSYHPHSAFDGSSLQVCRDPRRVASASSSPARCRGARASARERERVKLTPDLSVQQSAEVYHQNMFQITTHENAGMGGPLLHALTIPQQPSAMSPADAIASSLVSPTDTYASSLSSMSPTSSHGGPFTPADALRMMSLVQKDVPENVGEMDGAEHDVLASQMPFGFWPSDTLWANVEGLMPEDFNLGAIPPVELGLAQFEALPTSSGSQDATLGGEWPAGFETVEYAVEGHMGPPPAEEHDFDDTPTPGGPDGFSGMFGVSHEQLHMNW